MSPADVGISVGWALVLALALEGVGRHTHALHRLERFGWAWRHGQLGPRPTPGELAELHRQRTDLWYRRAVKLWLAGAALGFLAARVIAATALGPSAVDLFRAVALVSVGGAVVWLRWWSHVADRERHHWALDAAEDSA